MLTLEGILNVYGADFFHLSNGSLLGPGLGGLPMAAGIALAAVHLVGVALAAWGFFRAFRHFYDPGNLVSPVLATAIVVNVLAYVLSVIPVGVFDAREILAVLPFGAVLAGRMVPGQLAGVPRRLKPALAGASAAVLACYLAALGYGAAQPRCRTACRRSFPGWRHTTSPMAWALTTRRTSPRWTAGAVSRSGRCRGDSPAMSHAVSSPMRTGLTRGTTLPTSS